MAPLAIGFPVWATIFMIRNKNDLQKLAIKREFTVLYGTLNTHTLYVLLYQVAFLMRRLFYALIFVLLANYPSFQIILIASLSMVMLTNLIVNKPFKEQILNYMEIFNELTFAIVSYFFLLFTEFNQNIDLKTYIGWLLICLTLFNITVNYIIVIIKTVTQLINLIKMFIRKRK